MMFKCPVCKNRHSVPNNYDNSEFICTNGGLTPRTFNMIQPTDILESSMLNTASTKINEARPVTIEVKSAGYRKNGISIGKLGGRNY